MYKYLIPLMVSIGILFISCDNTFINSISRTIANPEPETPKVEYYTSLNGINISWSLDSQTDQFILSRQAMPNGASKVIYQGGALSYFDSAPDITPNAIYKYNLSKMRGSKMFLNGNSAYGSFDSQSTKDPAGDNGSKSKALEFTTFEIKDFLFYNTDGFGASIKDQDWFYSIVPANRTLTIKMVITDLAHQGLPELFNVNVIDQDGPRDISSSQYIVLPNKTNSPQKIYFCCSPNLSKIGTFLSMSYSLVFVNLQ